MDKATLETKRDIILTQRDEAIAKLNAITGALNLIESLIAEIENPLSGTARTPEPSEG
jgi:hypothetical protein